MRSFVLFKPRAVFSRLPLRFTLQQFGPFHDTAIFPTIPQITNEQLARGDLSGSCRLALVLLFQLLGLP